MDEDYAGMSEQEIAWHKAWDEEERIEHEQALKDLKRLKHEISYMQSELVFLKDCPDLASTIQFMIVDRLHRFSSEWHARWLADRANRRDKLNALRPKRIRKKKVSA